MKIARGIGWALLGLGCLWACSQQESTPDPSPEAETPAKQAAPSEPESKASANEAASSVQEAPAETEPETNTTANARGEAEAIFAARCATCHGPQGAGDGPTAAALTPPPRNFQDHTWQVSVSDEHIEKIILQGGAAVGLSPLMPPNPDLSGKPEVIAALRAYVRELATH